jgi:hypothetical protein
MIAPWKTLKIEKRAIRARITAKFWFTTGSIQFGNQRHNDGEIGRVRFRELKYGLR